MFRRGEADPDVRLHAARGALAPRALEQLALLMVLSADPDVRVRDAAAQTIDRIPPPSLAAFLGRAEVPDAMRQWFATREAWTPAPAGEVDPDAPLIDASADAAAAGDLAAALVDAKTEEEARQVLSLMTVLERLKLAMRGTREQRAVLVRDPNRMVAVAVMSSPKLSEPEVEAFAKMTTVGEEVLRIIGTNRAWTRNYTIALALARNPKAPTAIALQMVPRLTERDMKQIASDRNVPEPVRLSVRKFLIKTQRGG